MTSSLGHVYLVGAGPGPLDLLTLRARRLLREADVVAYDDLVHPSLLAEARPDCEILAIGYRAGDKTKPPPLHPLVLERAKAGKRVVRLKAGDPLIFARGGEEAQALGQEGIGFTFVPGVTAALAAASSCHLPLTWRGLSAEVRLLTPQASDHSPLRPTLSVYMPKQGIEAYTRKLIAQGWPRDTPAAYVMAAAGRRESCVRATLETLPQIVMGHASSTPGLVLVGEALAQTISNPVVKVHRPLQGLQIVWLKHHPDPSRLGSRLRKDGADVWEWPWIKSRFLPTTFTAWHVATQHRDTFAVCSAAAWDCLWQQLRDLGLDLRCLAGKRLVSLSESATQALRRSGLEPDEMFKGIRALDQFLERSHIGGIPVLVVGLDSEVGRAQDICGKFAWGGDTWTVGQQLRQEYKMPSCHETVLVVPHRKALRLLQSHSESFLASKTWRVFCFGSSLVQDMLVLGWRPDRIHHVSSFTELQLRLEEVVTAASGDVRRIRDSCSGIEVFGP